MREKPSFYVALTPIIFMMIVLVVGIGVMGWPASVCLLISAAFSCIIAMAKLKYTRMKSGGLLSIRFRR